MCQNLGLGRRRGREEYEVPKERREEGGCVAPALVFETHTHTHTHTHIHTHTHTQLQYPRYTYKPKNLTDEQNPS